MKKTLLVVLVLAFIFTVYKIAFSANQGLSGSGTVWVGTESGNADSTGTDTRTNALTVKAIVFSTAADTNVLVLRDGANTDTLLRLKGNQTVTFGEGKVFRKGIYVNSITSGASVYIFFK